MPTNNDTPTIDFVINQATRAYTRYDDQFGNEVIDLDDVIINIPQLKNGFSNLESHIIIDELKSLVDQHDAENSFGYFIQDRIKALEAKVKEGE